MVPHALTRVVGADWAAAIAAFGLEPSGCREDGGRGGACGPGAGWTVGPAEHDI